MMQIILYARLKHKPRSSEDKFNQRKSIESIIEERNAAHRRVIHAAQVDQRTSMAPQNLIALQRPEDNYQSSGWPSECHAEAVRNIGGPNSATSSATSSKPRVENGQRRRHKSDHYKNNDPSRDPSPDTPGDAQVSYWLALSVVCCPCFSAGIQRLFRMTRRSSSSQSPHDISSSTLQLSTSHQQPIERSRANLNDRTTQSVSNTGGRRKVAMLSPLASRTLAAKAHTTMEDSGFNTAERTSFPEVPGEHFRNKDLLDITNAYNNSLTPRRTRASQRLDSEVDRLLREWTTIYDVLVPLHEEGAGDGYMNSRESIGGHKCI